MGFPPLAPGRVCRGGKEGTNTTAGGYGNVPSSGGIQDAAPARKWGEVNLLMKKTLTAALALGIASLGAASASAGEIAWRDWSDEAFVAARREHKLVLLDLGAVWCHWCHV